MTDAPQKKKAVKISLCIAAVVISLATAAVIYCAFFYGRDFVRIDGANAATEITVVLEENGKARSLSAKTDGTETVFNTSEEKPSIPYALAITLRQDAIYRDVRLSVNEKTASLIAEGFTPKGALSWNEQSDLHFDWSGRIELKQELAGHKGPLCFNVDNISICHNLPKVAR